MALEQAAEAAKIAAETEGYDAGLTPDARRIPYCHNLCR